MTRVALLGLDAAESMFVEQLMADGDMPQLERIRSRSARFKLKSEETWRSGRVWETFLTGAVDSPSAIIFDPGTYQTFLHGAPVRRPFYATVPGIRLVALDVPYMSLLHEVEGAQVTAWGGHDAGYPRASRPAGLLTEIDTRFGNHPAYLNDFSCGWHHAASIEALTDALLVGTHRRAEVVGWLLERFPDWDLFMTVMSEAHSAGEYFWHGVDPSHLLASAPSAELARESLLKTHRAIDRAIGTIIESLPDDCYVVVCSLHGMQRNYYDITSMAIVPELLYRWQFGRRAFRDPNPEAWRKRGFPPMTLRQDEKWNTYMRKRFTEEPPRSRRKGLAHNLKGTPSHALGALGVPIPAETEQSPEDIGQPTNPLDWHVCCWYRKYWPSMKAFALPSFYDSRIRINVRGRERHGIVDPADYDRVRSEVESLLKELRDPRTGRPAVDDIVRLRERDPLDPEGPDGDLLATWNEATDALEHPRLGTIGPFPFRRTGGHTSNGFAFVSGPSIEPGDRETRSALDLTPTIISLLGHEPVKEMEGRSVFHMVRAEEFG